MVLLLLRVLVTVVMIIMDTMMIIMTVAQKKVNIEKGGHRERILLDLVLGPDRTLVVAFCEVWAAQKHVHKMVMKIVFVA